MFKQQSLLIATCLAFLGASLTVSETSAAEPPKPAKANIAKICTSCHKAEGNQFLGYFDNVAFKSKTIQIKVDEATQLFRFDEDEIKVVNGEGKTGDGELLRKVAKGHEIKIEFTEQAGVKTALRLVEKPPVKLPQEMVISTPEMVKLVNLGPEKGNFSLFDSRPFPRFQEAAIPHAVSLPFPAFDKMAAKLLPADKNQLIIFYCGGLMCNLSPGSADKAKKLGYTNIKVYTEGMPGWNKTNTGALTPQFLKEAWIDKDIPFVLLDARPLTLASKGFIKGAVSFPAENAAELLKKLPPQEKKAPIMIYDDGEGVRAAKVAKALLNAKYGKVAILTGGFEAWKKAGYEAQTGSLETKATYVPKPRPGEISIEEFKKIAGATPANVMILDVRNADEVKNGKLKGARQIAADEIKEHLADIPKDKMIVTHCATGVRAEMAYHALKELGYQQVRFLNANLEFDKNGTYHISKE